MGRPILVRGEERRVEGIIPGVSSAAVKGLAERWRRAGGTEDFAWACLVANAVGVPGMGTLMARRREGVAQIALAIAGGVLMTWWIVAFVVAELRTMTFPPEDGPSLGPVLWGLGFFVASWVWALLSSVIVLQAARHRPPGAGSGR
jgi:hypothetical protein